MPRKFSLQRTSEKLFSRLCLLQRKTTRSFHYTNVKQFVCANVFSLCDFKDNHYLSLNNCLRLQPFIFVKTFSVPLAPPNEEKKQHCVLYQSKCDKIFAFNSHGNYPLVISTSILVPPLVLQQPQPRIRTPTNFVIWMFPGSEYLWIPFWDFSLHLFKTTSPKASKELSTHCRC